VARPDRQCPLRIFCHPRLRGRWRRESRGLLLWLFWRSNHSDVWVLLFFRSQAFSPAKVIFAGIGVLLSVGISSPFAPIIVTHKFIFFQAASDVGAGRAMLVEHFSRVEYFFNRLETYTTVPPTVAMTNVIVEIMVAMLSFLALATRELKRGRMGKPGPKRFMGTFGGSPLIQRNMSGS